MRHFDISPTARHVRRTPWRRRGIRWGAGLLVASVVTLIPAPGAAAENPSCSATITTAISFTVPVLDWAENLAYDRQGQLWVTRTARGVVERYDESGRRTAIVEALGPSGIRLGPDGLMYVYSVHLPTMLSGPQSVIRFDPADPNPQPEVFATGLLAPNGIVFDAEGYLYATDMWSGVIRIRPDGSIDHEWTARAKVLGSDGITVIDRDLYLNLLFSAGGQILRIPIDAPERRSVLTQLDPGPLPAGNDDLAVGRDGMLYVATGFGRLLRVDPATGNSCTLAALEPITAVAVAPDGNLMLSSESGNILRARV